MDNKIIRTAGVIAGIVVVLGVLIIGAQYLPRISGGASAEVMNIEKLPSVISVSKEDYATVLADFDRYWSAHDLATKNQIIKEMQVLVGGLAK